LKKKMRRSFLKKKNTRTMRRRSLMISIAA
jgi:hypothetical protein